MKKSNDIESDEPFEIIKTPVGQVGLSHFTFTEVIMGSNPIRVTPTIFEINN